MIGVIVTGHGHFASGITASVDLIAGPQKEYVAVDFDGEGTTKLEADMKYAVDTLSDCNGIIIFADLAGGSPFKTAAIVTAGKPNVKVIGGASLPMLCEIVMARTMIDDVDTLVSTALNVGRDSIQLFEMPTAVDEEVSDGEGI